MGVLKVLLLSTVRALQTRSFCSIRSPNTLFLLFLLYLLSKYALSAQSALQFYALSVKYTAHCAQNTENA